MLDISKIRKVYLIGIKGSGMVAIAELLSSQGISVTGSDAKEKFFTDDVLEKLNIKYFRDFDKNNIPLDIDLVIYSTAYNEENNSEFQESRHRGLPMMSYPEILADIFGQKFGIAVTGTHGKTTTTAWLAHVLKEAGLDPTAVVGSRVVNWGGNAILGQGDFFVAEADEFQNKLKLYEPKVAILTSTDFDHPDFFHDFNAYKEVFREFVAKISKSGFLVVWGDSIDTLEISESATCEVLTYGFTEDCDFICKRGTSENEIGEVAENFRQKFSVTFGGKDLGEFEIGLVGQHNGLNATAVVATCYKLGVDISKVREGLLSFLGTARRFERIGERS
jgi:UDP-N-acetylmuramate--alanine ligase